MPEPAPTPIDIRLTIPALGRPHFPWPQFRDIAERVLALKKANAVLLAASDLNAPNGFQALADAMGIRIEATGPPPAAGPLLVVANHPYGGVDGPVLGAWLMKMRTDTLFIANESVAHIPVLISYVLPVDVFGRKEMIADNAKALRAAFAHLRKGGALMAFPSGTVSHWQSKLKRVADPEWNPSVFELARRTGAAVQPIGLEGRNGPVFQCLGRIHPMLRTALLPRSFMRCIGKTFRLNAGEILTPADLQAFANATEAAKIVRERVESLARCRN